MKKIGKYIVIAIPLILICTTAIAFFLKYPTNEKQTKYSEYINQASTLLEQKEYAKATNLYNNAAELVSNRYEAYEGIAKILSMKNQLGQLTDVISKSTSGLQPQELAKLYEILASSYIEAKNPLAAKPFYEKSLTYDSNLESARLGMAKCILLLGETEKISDYLTLQKENPLYEEQYVLKLFSKTANIEQIKEVIGENLVSEDIGRKAIIEEYKKISLTDPKEDIYISALVSKQLLNNGFAKLTISILEPLVEKIMEYNDGVYLLASAYFNNEEYEKALTLLKDFSNPNLDPDIYLIQARIYEIMNDDTLASKNYESATTSAGSSNEPIYKEYIEYLLSQTLYNKAKEMLDKAGKANKDAWIDIAYLRMHFEQKNSPKAIFYFDKLSKNPSLTDLEKKEYLYWGINQMIETQKYNEGLIALARLKEIDKTNPKYYLLAGKLHLQTTNVNEAKTELEQAIDYDITGEVTESAKKLLSRVN